MAPHVVILPRRFRVRVRVYRAGEWVDITSRVASGTIRESNDQPVSTLDLRLLNGRQYPSLAPRRKDSPLNQVNGQYVPLLWIGRLIAVEAAFSEDGSEPDEWWPVFLGELGDEIDTESGPDGTYVRLFCRDMAARLQRAYIAGPKTYENMYASQMIQSILDDAYSEGLIQEPVTVRLVGPDDFWVERYDIEYTDLWSALQRFCQQRGTDLRYRLNETTGQIELTYWLPDRTMVPGWVIDASQVRREELRISGTDIINRVTVRYRDAQTGQRAEVTVQDEDSIAMYGLRHGLIEEPDTDLIPDAATAQTLAQTIVDDLKDVPALTRLTVPFDPRIQLFDTLRVTNPNVRDEPEDYAIEGRELSFSATDWLMVLTGGSRVVVKRQAWLERLATEGVKQPFTPRDTTTAREPGAPTGLTGQFVGTDAVFSWDELLDPYHRRFVVEVRVGGQLKRRDYVEATSYTYTLDMNRHDNGAPSPQVELRVYSEYTTGVLSAPAIVAVSHPAPPQPTLSLRSSSAQIRWTVTSTTPPAWEATTVQVGAYSETVAAMSGTVDAVEAGIADGSIATVTVKLRDVFGQESQPATGQVTVNYLDKAAFAADIRPVELVSALPQLPNPQYPQGSVVFLTTDNKLYRSTGNSWTAAVPTTDLSGTITETQIADDAVTTPKLKAGAVTTDKLAAEAVTADKLAANSVTAGKIAAGAVKADAIDAGAVTADKLAADSVTANAIAAGAVTADAIDAGAIGAEHVRAESITAEHIQAGAIRSEHIQSEAIDTRHLKAGIIESQHIRVGDPLGIAARLGSTRPPGSLPEGGILFHFDHGLSSTRGVRPLPGYVATLRPGQGRFDGAVAVEEGTTNCIVSRDFETWGSYVTDNATGTVEFRQDPIYGKVVKLKKTDGGSGRFGLRGTLSGLSGSIYTHSVYVRALSGTGRIACMYVDAARTGGGLITSSTYRNLSDLPLGQWVRIATTRDGSPDTLAGGGSVFVWVETDNGECEFAYPQVEAKPFATSFVDGTRAAGRLSYPKSLIAGLNALTVAAWTSGPPYWVSGNKYLVAAQTTGTIPYGDIFALRQLEANNRISLWVRNDANSSAAEVAYDNVWDGNWHLIVGVINKFPQPGRQPIELYVDGELVASSSNVNAVPDLSTIDETWGVQVGNWRGGLQWNGLIDELLILPYAASEDEIRAWYELGAPFYDAAGDIGIDTPDGHVIELDREGMRMTPAGFSHPGMILTGYSLQFWDKDKIPSIGIGDVRDMAAQLGSDMQYGFLMNQGEIRASQAVLEASLTDLGVTRDKLGPGSVDRSKLSPGAVGEQQIQERGIGITRLGEQIQVPLISSLHLNVLRTEGSSIVARQSWNANTWYTIESFSLAKRDLSKGQLMEAMRLVLHVKAGSSTADSFGVRLLVAGSTVAHWDYGTFSDNDEMVLSVDMDARSLPDHFTVEWQWRRQFTGSTSGLRWESHYRRIYQNDQLPLRWGAPQYSMDGRPPTGCFGGCQISCQSGCEASCQATCESSCQGGCQQSCQSACESSCQSTCETTSQGGGGCIREGTPITIWDPDIQAYREVPVEQLQPGMILPGYNPETDTLEHGELIRLEDAKFSNRFLRIHTDNGPSVDVTYTQPFDVLADMGDGWRWYRLHAKFLKPGMKLVRPFEDPDKRLSTITKVEHVKEHMVHFWNPKVSNDRYLAAGYADWVTK